MSRCATRSVNIVAPIKEEHKGEISPPLINSTASAHIETNEDRFEQFERLREITLIEQMGEWIFAQLPCKLTEIMENIVLNTRRHICNHVDQQVTGATKKLCQVSKDATEEHKLLANVIASRQAEEFTRCTNDWYAQVCRERDRVIKDLNHLY